MILRRRPRLLVALAVALTLLILFSGALFGIRAAVAWTLENLPIPISYDAFRLTLRPLGVELRGARTTSLPGLPVEESRAEKVRIAVDISRARTLLAGERSMREILRALRHLEATGLAARLTLPSYTGEVRTETLLLQIAGGAEPHKLESPGFQLSLQPRRTEQVTYAERPDGAAAPMDDPSRESREQTIADMLNLRLEEAVALTDTLPRLSFTSGESTIRVDGDEAILSGKVEGGDGELLAASMAIGELPLTLLDPSGKRHRLGGSLSGKLDLAVVSESAASLRGNIAARRVSLNHERLAEERVGPVDLRYKFDAMVDTAVPVPPPQLARRVPGTEDPPPIGAGAPDDAGLRGRLEVTAGTLRIGSVTLEARPILWGLNAPSRELPMPLPARLDLEISLPQTPLQDIVDSTPASLLGPLKGTALEGTLTWDISLEAPFRRLSWTWWEETSRVDGFQIIHIDPAYDIRSLAGAFRQRLGNGPGGQRRLVVVPPSGGGVPNPQEAPLLGTSTTGGRLDPGYRFVPYQDIAPALIGAVVTAEDGEYFRHNGVNWRALTFAAQRNLLEGEVVVGGSTIPMQLAKNLFLDGDRVIARKLQELAFVALANLSGAVSRERILEIYLNLIEFGPGVRGIAEATAHYFGRSPAELTVEQSVWLASIIRSPHFLSRHARVGRVPPYWLERMEGIMELMVERGRLTDEELQAARGVQPEFAVMP
jgi:hypothetical protein